VEKYLFLSLSPHNSTLHFLQCHEKQETLTTMLHVSMSSNSASLYAMSLAELTTWLSARSFGEVAPFVIIAGTLVYFITQYIFTARHKGSGLPIVHAGNDMIAVLEAAHAQVCQSTNRNLPYPLF
jgi:hypothetical protein